MNIKTFSLVLLSLIILVLPVVSAGAEKSNKPVIVEEDTLVVLADDADTHFKAAYENFLKKDMKAAATEMRKGAAYLKMETSRASGKTKEALDVSVRDLEGLADGVERGTVTSVTMIEHAFAKAYYALAEHHQEKAEESFGKKAIETVGHELKAAALYLEEGFAWSGHKVETGTATVIKETRHLGGKLLEGTGWATTEVGKGISTLGGEVEKLGGKIQSAGK